MRFRELPKIKRRRNRDGSATWWAEWFETVSPGQRKHRSVVLGDARKLTKAEARDRLQDALDAEAPTSATWTVERFVREVWFPPRLKRWPYNTRRNVEAMMDAHILPVFGEMRLCDVRKYDVERWLMTLADKGYRKTTGRALLTRLKSIFDDALDNGILEKNPAARVNLPEMADSQETAPYTAADVRILVCEPGIDGLILRTMLFCGLRPGEALAIEPGDIVGHTLTVQRSTDYSGHVKATKTKRTRTVALPPILAVELTALADATPLGKAIFGRWHSVAYLQEVLRDRLGGIVPGFSLRRCRTTFATEYRGDPADVQALLGHSKLGMTMEHYRRAIPRRQAEAVADLEKRAMNIERVQ